MWPSLGFHYSKIILLPTCPYFDNLEFDIFDAGGPQSATFIMSVTIAVRIQKLPVH